MLANRLESQALEAVQSALDGESSMLEAAHALRSLLPRMRPDLVSRDDINLVVAIDSETDHLPIGPVRQLWHPDSLAEKDRDIARYEEHCTEKMRSACERIRRTLLLERLVVTRHLNVSERSLVGPVERREVSAILKSLLLAESVFPSEGREGFAYEGTIIGRTSAGAEIIHSRAYASEPQRIAERRVDPYPDVDSAIESFIDSEWPDGIDGIELMN